MPFSFDDTIRIVNDAANTLTRAARDLGDELPDNPATDALRDTLAKLTECVSTLTTTRDQAAARGTSSANAVVVRDVQRDPNGMASPGADLPPDVDADTIADDQKTLEEYREQEAERVRLAERTVMPVVIVDQPTATPTVTKSSTTKSK